MPLSKTQTTCAFDFRSMLLDIATRRPSTVPKFRKIMGICFAAESIPIEHSDLSRFVLNLPVNRIAFGDDLIQRNQIRRNQIQRNKRQRWRLPDGVEHQRACIGFNPSCGVAGIGNHVGHLARCAGLSA
jgi:hypothetical protein